MSTPDKVTFAQAIRDATDEAMARDERVCVLGQGVDDTKSIFGTTRGLKAKYGGRVIEVPVSEAAVTGLAIGMAMMGKRPILVHQRMEFALLGFEQLVNNAAKLHWITNGEYKCPLVVRMIVGRGWGQGPQHGQNFSRLFCFPGIKVVMPAFVEDAKAMMLAAIADDNPVVFIEHRWLHGLEAPAPGLSTHHALSEFGPRVVRRGNDITLGAYGYMVHEALRAAKALGDVSGVSTGVIDVRTMKTSLAEEQEMVTKILIPRSGRTLMVEDEMRQTPLPSSPSLAAKYYVSSLDIAVEVLRLLGHKPPWPAKLLEACPAYTDTPHPGAFGPF